MTRKFKEHLAEVNSAIGSVSGVIPTQRALHKAGFTFTTQPFEVQLEIWNHIWKNSGYRTQLHAFFFIERYITKKELLGILWETSVSWQEEVNDWPLCDALAKINSKALEVHPTKVYPVLAEWNTSTDLWKRRQSVVSLLYYSRTKKEFLPFSQIAAMVAPLLNDNEYYVQKGVGWTIREMNNVYPVQTVSFLQEHIKNISAIAFTIAIEKFTDTAKDALKLLRKSK